jgi:hypothetical protein
VHPQAGTKERPQGANKGTADQPVFAARNVIHKSLDDPEWTHRVHAENLSPVLVIDMPRPLPRHTGDAGIIDEVLDRLIPELPSSAAHALTIGHIHFPAQSACTRNSAPRLQLLRRLGIEARGKYLPLISGVPAREGPIVMAKKPLWQM